MSQLELSRFPVVSPWGSNGTSTGDITTSYAADVTTVLDQASHRRSITRDGLGRLSQVTEDPGGLNYTTLYSYDALDNLSGVTQVGQGRIRDSHHNSRIRDVERRAGTSVICRVNAVW